MATPELYAAAIKGVADVLNSEGGQEILKATPALVDKSLTQGSEILKTQQNVSNEIVKKAVDKILEKGGVLDASQKLVFEDIARDPGAYSDKIMKPVIENLDKMSNSGIEKLQKISDLGIGLTARVPEVTKYGVTSFQTVDVAMQKSIESWSSTIVNVLKKDPLLLGWILRRQEAKQKLADEEEQKRKDEAARQKLIADAKTQLELAKINAEANATAPAPKVGGNDFTGGCVFSYAKLIVFVLFLVVAIAYWFNESIMLRNFAIVLGVSYITLQIVDYFNLLK